MTPSLARSRTRPALVAASVVAVAAALLGPAPPGTAGTTSLTSPNDPASPVQRVPGVPGTEFDPASTAWYSYRDQSSDKFAATFERLKGAYLPIDLEIDTDDGYDVGSVWQANSTHRGWREKRDLTSSEFHDYWAKAKQDGYRLIEQETYRLGGTRNFAGIWLRNPEGYRWASRRGQTTSAFDDSRAAYKAAGLMPIDIDEYVVDGKRRWSSVWVESTSDWKWVLDKPVAVWRDRFEDLSAAGYRPISFDSVRTANGQRYSGIWVADTTGRQWALRRDMTAKTYNNRWYRYRDQGFRLVGLDHYTTANGTRYAGIWRQNSTQPDWEHRAEVDDVVADDLAELGLTGVSVAVLENGTPRYTRGFGFANKADEVWMDSYHIGQLASISKAVGSVLSYRMQEDASLGFSVGDATRDWVPSMPAQHTHTIGQLLSMRGCVRHYVDGKDGFGNKSYATALAAAEKFWDDALVCDPLDPPAYHYSTHGLTLVGAALEAAGDHSVKYLVKHRLTIPFKLGTLGIQTTGGHRMTPYSSSGSPLSEPDNDWKVLGGGIESNAVDLASFGDKLVRGQILGPVSRRDMWNPPDTASTFAHGFFTGTRNSNDFVGMNGSGTGARTFLLIFPRARITIAVLVNTGSGSELAGRFANDIADLIVPTPVG